MNSNQQALNPTTHPSVIYPQTDGLVRQIKVDIKPPRNRVSLEIPVTDNYDTGTCRLSLRLRFNGQD
jgi:hypothetical protein